MRIAAVHLPFVRIELARARLAPGETSAPLAVVIARPGGAVDGTSATSSRRGRHLTDERSLLGGTRLDEVSREARACGVRAGDTIAAARAKEAALLVRVVPEHAVRGVLESVAEAALAFGRTASIDEARDVVCVDVTGCAHLFHGEEALAAALRDRVRTMHHAARVGVADGPRVATAIARHARTKSATCVIAPGGNAPAIAALPVTALPIDGASIAWLTKLGVACIGDLQRLPARGLSMRLGAVHDGTSAARPRRGPHQILRALLDGDDAAPLDPYVPPEVPEERAELEYGIDKTEQLVFVVKMLCDRLAARLAGRAMAAARIELVLSLDRAMLRDRDGGSAQSAGRSTQGDPARASLPLTFPAPMATAAELLAVTKARVESWTIEAPILAVTLRAPELARKEGRALDLFEPEAKAERALPRLVAELAADLGVGRVGTLALANTWVAEERTVLLPFGQRAEKPPGVALEGVAPEPSRMLHAPVASDAFEPVRLLARVECVEWWRGVDGGPAAGAVRSKLGPRDFVAAWSAKDKRMAWVAIEDGVAQVRGWMD